MFLDIFLNIGTVNHHSSIPRTAIKENGKQI